ncbi:hypothetical protein [Alkalimarinus sediminis]|uniref:Lipoprotein n=1 Tax=Alkalimarinus sediminis TaxID=1632866 RepID=A0A9E8HRD7_9ALTE|nr:hypothetical protein [Alkalimarinus sediminis]UZW75086.1 hypothetical protein NNL22_00325 [Alkalimarinus sediminis]
MKRLLLASISALSLGLVGCDDNEALGSNGQPICLNTAVPFEYPIPTFVVDEQVSLERSSSWDYLQGIQQDTPVADITDILTVMEAKIKQFAVYEGPVTGITSLNNAIDTMDQTESAVDTAGNIQSGKIQIQGAINDNVSCSYNNKAALLRDESNSDDATNFLPYILDYSYISSSKQLSRTIAYYKEVTKIIDGEEKTTNEILATSLTGLNPDTFQTSGYNAPLSAVISWGDSEESLKITKDYQTRIDRGEYVSATEFTAGIYVDIKRLKVSINYEIREAKIYTSKFVNAVTCHPDTVNEVDLYDPTPEELAANNCSNIEDRVTLRDPGYDITDIDPDVPDSGTPPTPTETYTGTFVDGR